MHVLVAGWFSFEEMGTTAGDLIARDIVCDWLKDSSASYEVAAIDKYALPGAVNWKNADSTLYTDVIFVCGPFGNGWPVTDFLAHFSSSRFIGINLSMLQSLETWNPFTLLYERDSSRASNPDITFYSPAPKGSVVGVILAHKQKEYGAKSLHEIADDAIAALLQNKEASVIHIDTALEENKSGLRTPNEVESLIAKMDMVITTRLHGTVLAIKNGVPVIPIDPVAGGAKITKQVHAIGWPILLGAENLNVAELNNAYEYCLTAGASIKAKACAESAYKKIEQIRHQFSEDLAALAGKPISRYV